MSIFHTIILSIVEGITEFLPISSTGHIIIVSDLLGIPSSDFLASFTIAIQLGAILAVVGLYARRLVTDFEIWKKITLAFMPTALVGVVFFSLFKGFLSSPLIAIIGVFVGGVIMILVELWLKKKNQPPQEKITYKNAFIIGLAQVVAFIPGISRSAATIIGGLSLGLSRKTVVEFSFLLALPTMVVATGYDLFKTGATFQNNEWGILLLGIATSFLVAIIAIKWLLRFVEKYTFIPFGVYRIVLAPVLLLLLLL